MKNINRETSGEKGGGLESRRVECVTAGFSFFFCGRILASGKAVNSK